MFVAKSGPSPLDDSMQKEGQATMERQQHQSDALRRLSGSTALTSGLSNMSVSPSGSSTAKHDGMSLAAFIGGKATGPKLNKPAPQVDSSDPNLFDQTRRQGPHPVFGRPSDALAAASRFTSKPQTTDVKNQGTALANTDPKSIISVTSRASVMPSETVGKLARSSPEIPKKPEILRKPSDKIVPTSEIPREVGPLAQPGTPPDIPTKPRFPRPQSQQQHSSLNESLPSPSSVVTPPKPASLAELIGGRASAPRLTKPFGGESSDGLASSSPGLTSQRRGLPGMSDTSRVSSPPIIISASPKPVLSRSSSQQDASSDTPSSSRGSSQTRTTSGSRIVTPSLARPVQPQVVVQPSPVAAVSSNPSPAFLRATPSTQDLHPSLSRLQGRGFVEQRVKASTQLYGDSLVQQRERTTSSGSCGQRPTVLDRWQPTMASSSPSSPSSFSNIPTGQRDVTSVTPGVPPSISVPQLILPRTISSGPVRPKVEEEKYGGAQPVRLPGMSNSTSFPPRQRTPTNPSAIAPNVRMVETHETERRDQRDMSRAAGPLSHVSPTCLFS